jgi:DNA-binding transcriptional LysR family regulator
MISAIDISYFIEVANTQNLSRAAERIGITQPSLSAAIKRLETSIGTELLIRHKKGVLLTQAGKQLLTHSKQLLQYWDEVKSQALASHFEVQGHYVFGCHPSVAMSFLPGILPDLLKDYPKLEIELAHDISRKIVEGVINLSIDIAIVVNPVKHPDLIIHKLIDDEVTFWQPKHPKFPHQDIYSNEAVILCNPELAQTQALLKKLQKKNIRYSRLLVSNNLEVIAELTASGCGVGILPHNIVKNICQGKLSPAANITPFHDEICLVYRSENRSIKAIQVVIGAVKDYFKNSMLL